RTPPRPTLDPELHGLPTSMPLISQLSPEILAQLRQLPATPAESLLARWQASRREVTMPARDGALIPLSLFSPANADRTAAAPCVYWMHGGAMVMGDRFSQTGIPLEWPGEPGAVVIRAGRR